MGLSNRDIDNQLKYDDRTGEVYFGGKSLGKTQANVDGVSYYDSDTLNSAFNDYVNRAGITAPKEQLAQQLWQNLVGNYKDYYDNMVKENPYTNEVGKSILSKYDLAGYTAGNNAAASAAASNGGNIDSFAAGNAMRNQAALIAMGQEKALAAQNQKLERARDILSNMGVDAEKIFNASETEKNNDVTRNATIADVTGYTPEQWTYANNPYLNDDGTLVRESDNFKEFMDTAREKLKDTTLSADERKKWQDQYNYAAQARRIKLGSRYNADGRYSQYDDGDYIYTPQYTEKAREANMDDSLQRYITDKNNDTSLAISRDTNATNLQMNQANADANKEIANNGYASQERMNRDTIAGNQKQLDTSLAASDKAADKSNAHETELAKIYSQGTSSGGSNEANISDWVNWINSKWHGAIDKSTDGKYTVQDNYKWNVHQLIQSATDLSDTAKDALEKVLGLK